MRNSLALLFLTSAVMAYIPSDAQAQAGVSLSYAEYFIDSDPGYGSGTSIPLSPGEDVYLNFSANISGISDDVHTLYTRIRDDAGVWSLPYAQVFLKESFPPHTTPQITFAEYYIDTDPGYGNGIVIPLSPGIDVDQSFVVDITPFNDDIHYLCVRIQDEYGRWSLFNTKIFMKVTIPQLTFAEYYIDTDPGFGKGIAVPLASGIDIDHSFIVNLTPVSDGIHYLTVRLKDEHGKWSLACTKVFMKESFNPAVERNIAAIEYFIDSDPGQGNGVPVSGSPSGALDHHFIADLNTVDDGIHYLNVRVKDDKGAWSLPFSKVFVKEPYNPEISPPITQVEYHFENGVESTPVKTFSSFATAADVELSFPLDISGLTSGNSYDLHMNLKDSHGGKSLDYVHQFTFGTMVYGTLEGIARDSRSNIGIAGAVITIIPGNFTAVSDVNGAFTLQVPAGIHYQASAVKPEYLPSTLEGIDIPENSTTSIIFTLSPDASSVETKTVVEAAADGWINLYAYVFDGTDYVIVDPTETDDIPIQKWQGFWVGVKKYVDLLIPKTAPEPSLPPDMNLVMAQNRWYLISTPLDPGPGNRDLSSNLSVLGEYEHTWRAVKWDYTYTGTSDMDGYKIYTGPGTGFPELLPGRGFWLKQINDNPRTIHITGTPVSPSGEYFELQLPANGSGNTTAHMVGNPYWYSIRWKEMLIRKPSTGTVPVGKPVSYPGSVKKWFVGIKLEAVGKAASDTYNRAGVVMTEGVDSKIYDAFDLIPPDSYINVKLKDPSDNTRAGLAYDFRAAGQTEYQWELNLSTSYSSIPVRLSLDNLANVPKGVQFTLKDLSTEKTSIIAENISFSLTLYAGTTHKFLLTAQMGSGSATSADASHPVAFGITSANPNPFNPSTTINFGMEKSGNVKLTVYSINGQLVESLVDGVAAAGLHSTVWNAKGRSSGVYLVVLEANGKLDSRKVSLVK